MALEQHHDTDAPQARSLDAIQRDLGALDRRGLDETTADLDKVRWQTRTLLDRTEAGSAGWRAILDEAEPDLDRLERSAIQQLEAVRRSILADRDQLQGIPYRPNLPADQTAAAEAKASSLAARLPGMSAADVQRAIKGAVLFTDAVTMAAWALLAGDLESRFPRSERVKDADGRDVSPAQLFDDLIRQCEVKTGDRQVIETREKLEAQLAQINQRIAGIATARNQHNPTGNVGGALLSYHFGSGSREDVAHQRRYDPQAVATRLGVKR